MSYFVDNIRYLKVFAIHVFICFVCLFFFLHYLALVYGFNVSVLPEAETYAARNHITVKHQNIIYRFLDDIKNEINKRIPPKEVEEVIGTFSRLNFFCSSFIGIIDLVFQGFNLKAIEHLTTTRVLYGKNR